MLTASQEALEQATQEVLEQATLNVLELATLKVILMFLTMLIATSTTVPGANRTYRTAIWKTFRIPTNVWYASS